VFAADAGAMEPTTCDQVTPVRNTILMYAGWLTTGRQVSRDFQWSFVMEPVMELGSEFRAHATGDVQCSTLFDPV
jgi:hypothetical protein